MCPYPWYQVMRLSKDKKQQRYQMVIYAKEHGVKPTARLYATTPKTVSKWLHRYEEGGYQALEDLSRRPHHSPLAVKEKRQKEIVALRTKYKNLGADLVKSLEEIPESSKTIRKIWRKHGVSRRKRRKKHVTKQNLREVKKRFALFERVCEDTKDLDDIPEYYLQMKMRRLPQVQYTLREVSCGVQFLGFADDRSLTHAELFAEYVNEHLKKYGLIVESGIRQTDNGSEYIGSWSAKKPSAYTLAIESTKKLMHSTIPPGAHRFQSDVETVHNLIETDFYEIEEFADRIDFMEKAHAYQLFFNLERPNSYKENKSPWQLAKEKRPDIPKEALMLPPVDLDALLDKKLAKLAIGGYYVSSSPFFSPFLTLSHPLSL
jgi:transposase-like protein